MKKYINLIVTFSLIVIGFILIILTTFLFTKDSSLSENKQLLELVDSKEIIEKIPKEGKKEFIFFLINKSKQTISITDTISSCNCMTVNVSPNKIPPQKTTKITVIVSVGRSQGLFSSLVTVVYKSINDPTEQHFFLSFEYEVI